MSKAKRCDRCGKCFDPMDIPAMICRFSNPAFMTAEDIKAGKVKTHLRPDLEWDEKLDLCPECTGDFTLFMDGTPLALHENDFDKPDIKETKVTDGDDAEYQKTAFQKFLDRIDELSDEFFNDLEGYGYKDN